MSGEDEKAMKRLERFGSPSDLFKAYREAETKLSSGANADALPEGATDEQVAAYREQNGIPKEPSGYLDKLPDGMVLSDADTAVASGYLEAAHAANLPPEQANIAIAWYQDMAAKQQADTQAADVAFRRETTDALKAEYGGEYIDRLNSVSNFLQTGPKLEDGSSLADVLDTARLSDGRLLGDHPAILKFFADTAYQLNPAGYVSPGDSMGQLDSVSSELKGLKAQMSNPKSDYWTDPKVQERYRDLVRAEERLNGAG